MENNTKKQKTMILLSAALILILAFMAGCGGSTAPDTQQNLPAPQQKVQGNDILIKDFAFMPSTLTINMGDTVVWTNEDSAVHSIKSDSFNSGNLNTGEAFEFKFTAPGTYDYFCEIHPSMKGKIIVTALPD